MSQPKPKSFLDIVRGVEPGLRDAAAMRTVEWYNTAVAEYEREFKDADAGDIEYESIEKILLHYKARIRFWNRHAPEIETVERAEDVWRFSICQNKVRHLLRALRESGVPESHIKFDNLRDTRLFSMGGV